jgi:ribose 5-phosphate isomerase A
MELTLKQLQKLGCSTTVRMDGGKSYTTDNGNIIIDCDFKKIPQVDQLHHSINSIPGVVENGLFIRNIVSKVIVGYDNGEVKVITK